MENKPFTNLNFDRHWRVRFSGRATWLLIVAGSHVLAWALLPPAVLFWFGLPVIVALAWVASFAWREALASIDRLIHRIDSL